MRIDVWSDIACPWCYVGKRRLEAALTQVPGEVEVVWRAFELDPSAPRTPDPTPLAQRLARKYGMGIAQAEQMMRRTADVAATDGLALDFASVRSTSTFDAHRLVHLAEAHGRQGAMEERLFRAHFTEGRSVTDHATLRALAVEVGLDGAEVDQLLASDRYAREVRADQAEAQALGIRGVPFFVVDGRVGVSGAQPAEVLADAIRQAQQDRTGTPVDGAVCGPDGC